MVIGEHWGFPITCYINSWTPFLALHTKQILNRQLINRQQRSWVRCDTQRKAMVIHLPHCPKDQTHKFYFLFLYFFKFGKWFGYKRQPAPFLCSHLWTHWAPDSGLKQVYRHYTPNILMDTIIIYVIGLF